MANRQPNAEMRKILRSEVNFGCPVETCRSPFLSWHHFDPPWNEIKENHAEGIIALCETCHRHADGGSYTKDYLHELKQNPPTTPPEGIIPWKLNKIFVIVGGNYFFATKPNFSLHSPAI